MEIKRTSGFKDPVQDHAWFANWVQQLQTLNQRQYQRFELHTSLGKTHIWGVNTEDETLETLVIFPGARTTPLFWDFDKNLDNLGRKLRILMVETNGLPNPSDGKTPDIKSDGYGVWATEILAKLKLEKTFIAGASFGGLICMKLALVSPERIKAAFLLNPGCLQPFSLSLKNLYYNLLPILSPTKKNVGKFLNKAVFCKPTHTLSPEAEKLIVDYELFAITRYQDKTQKPYDMGDELRKVTVPVYLLEGDKDLLFPYRKSVVNAQEKLPDLKEVKVFENVAHGIETYGPALKFVGEKITELVKSKL